MYLWNHSSDVIVNGQTFQDWFIDSYMFNEVGSSPLVSGFFWDDIWSVDDPFSPDLWPNTSTDIGLTTADLEQLTASWTANMDALKERTISEGKFAWQLMWTGGVATQKASTQPQAIIQQSNCAAELRVQCNATAPPQTRAMMYGLQVQDKDPSKLSDLHQDLANFLLIRGPFAWLGHGWHGCSKDYPFPKELNLDYGEPTNGGEVCKETGAGTGIFTREWTKASVTMDCNKWEGTVTMK